MTGQGDLAALGELGTAKQWSPAIVAKYLGARLPVSSFRPFIGAGVTYNRASLNTGGTGTASLSTSWAPVANVGASYSFSDRWLMSLSVSYIPLKTNADITGNPAGAAAALGPQRYKTSIKLDPIVSFLSVGYKF